MARRWLRVSLRDLAESAGLAAREVSSRSHGNESGRKRGGGSMGEESSAGHTAEADGRT